MKITFPIFPLEQRWKEAGASYKKQVHRTIRYSYAAWKQCLLTVPSRSGQKYEK